jgi:adenosylcobinamide-phosphate synthase
MAGALNLRLAGSSVYGGIIYEKPYIGDDNKEITALDILNSHKILNITSIFTFALGIIFRGALYAIL